MTARGGVAATFAKCQLESPASFSTNAVCAAASFARCHAASSRIAANRREALLAAQIEDVAELGVHLVPLSVRQIIDGVNCNARWQDHGHRPRAEQRKTLKRPAAQPPVGLTR